MRSKDYSNYHNERKPDIGDINKYTDWQSDYAFNFHFNRRSNWGDCVVDFGGNIGAKTAKILNVTVVEVDKSARKILRQKKIKYKESLDEFEDDSIDTIYCSHVLEHLTNYHDYLDKFHEKLKKGGKLILVLPAENQSFEPNKEDVDSNGHLQTWTFKLIMTSLYNAGFKAIDWKMNMFSLPSLFNRIIRMNEKVCPFNPKDDKPALAYFIRDIYYRMNDFKAVRFMKYMAFLLIRPITTFFPGWCGMELYVVAEKIGD